MTRLNCFMKPLVLALACILLASQVMVLSGYLAESSHHRGVIAAQDDDASMAIERAQLTRLYNQVTSHFYGPVHNRLAHIAAALAPLAEEKAGWSQMETREKGHHLVLLLISLASLVCLSYLLVGLLSTNQALRLTGAALITVLFLSNDVWLLFVFRAHPDHLFGLLVALGTVYSFKAYQSPEDPAKSRTAALIWGVAAGTKLTILLFIPTLLLLVWRRRDRESFLGTSRFLGWALLAYFLVGFPASIQVDKTIKALVYQSQWSTFLTWESLQGMFGLFASQIFRPTIFLVILAFLFGTRREGLSQGLGRFVLIMHLPLVFLFSKNVISSNAHYPIPFVAVSLVCLALYLGSRVAGIIPALFRPSLLVMLILVWNFTYGLAPLGMATMLHEQTWKYPDAQSMYTEVKKLQMEGHKIGMTPYFPFSREFDSGVRLFWSDGFALLEAGEVEYLGINRLYFARYFEDFTKEKEEAYGHSFRRERSFYEIFVNKEETEDPQGRSWHLIRSSESGLDLWQRQPAQ